MEINVEQVMAGLENEEFFVKIGRVDVSIGFIPSVYGDMADVLAIHEMDDAPYGKQFDGAGCLEKAVAYANKIVRKLNQ